MNLTTMPGGQNFPLNQPSRVVGCVSSSAASVSRVTLSRSCMILSFVAKSISALLRLNFQHHITTFLALQVCLLTYFSLQLSNKIAYTANIFIFSKLFSQCY
jgi:hypothetical protein